MQIDRRSSVSWAARTVAALAAGFGTIVGAAEAAQAESAAVYTSKAQFRIPYRYDAEEMRRIGAREIRLYLSVDQGGSWQLADSVVPAAGRFEFTARGEGEYWFAVRTLDGRNQLYPGGGINEPGLKVVVDQTPPRLDVQLRPAPGGRVDLVWQAEDPALDIATLRLEYMQPGSAQWEPVGIAPSAGGQTSWSVPDAGMVAVRGMISDTAGNTQQVQTQTRIGGTAAPAAPTTRPRLDGPIASEQPRPYASRPAADPNGQDGNSLPTTTPFAMTGPDTTPQMAPQMTPQIAPAATHNVAPAATELPRYQGGQVTGGLVTDSLQTRPEIVRGRYEPLIERTDVGRSADVRPPQVGKHTRVVSTRQFHIDYKVEDIGPSGVGDVELYITEDDGRQWFKYGNDPDRQPPFVVDVPQDGLYGFALRVRSGTGLAVEPPQPNERPEVVVVVDQTPPVVRLEGAAQGQGADIQKVQVRWSVVEDYPAERPVALSYATDPNGVWEPITGWIDDAGHYTWTIAPNMPQRLYLRVTARDAAGNMSRTEPPEPLLIDLSRPSARIVDVESARTTGR
jgi:hypothetical protein